MPDESPEHRTDEPSNGSTALVRDVSLGGVGLLTGTRYAPGELLAITLPDTADWPSTVLACAVRATTQHGHEWIVGCRFTAELEEYDLPRFAPQAALPRVVDRRAWTRFPCAARVGCRLAQPGPPRRLTVAPVRVSAVSGIALISRPVEVGTLLEWDLPGALTILATVARVTEQGGRWEVVCPFIRELSEPELDAVRAACGLA